MTNLKDKKVAIVALKGAPLGRFGRTLNRCLNLAGEVHLIVPYNFDSSTLTKSDRLIIHQIPGFIRAEIRLVILEIIKISRSVLLFPIKQTREKLRTFLKYFGVFYALKKIYHKILKSFVALFRFRKKELLHARENVEIAFFLRGARTLLRLGNWINFWIKSNRLLQNIEPDLVFSCDFPGLPGAAKYSKKNKVVHIHDAHELYLESTSITRFEKRILTPVEKYGLSEIDGLVIVNESIKSELRNRYGVDGVVIRNIPSVPISYQAAGTLDTELTDNSSPNIRIVYSGGFLPGRGLFTLIQTMQYLPSNFRLDLLGFGPLEAELRELVIREDLESSVSFLNPVAQNKVVEALMYANIGILPYEPVSLNNLYSLPNKIFEYSAAGLAIVSSNLPEMVRLEVEGFLETFQAGESKSLALLLLKYENPAFLKSRRSSSRALLIENSSEKEEAKYLTYLSNILETNRRAESEGER